MSKMSMIHAELMEQCARLGFQDLGEAEQAGYGVDWQNAKLIKVEDEQEKAHEAWLKEKNKVLGDLDLIALHLDRRDIDKFTIQVRRIIENTIDFLEKGEC